MKVSLMLMAMLAVVLSGAMAQQNPAEAPLRVSVEAELGAVKVLHHTYQVGTDTTDFDFVKMGGQELLYPFQRMTVALGFGEGHQVRFLYQPLQLDTRIIAREAFTIDNVSFAVGQPVDITYSFPFYRISYLYDLLPGPAELSVGAALQLRNASIRFAPLDGSDGVVSQNLGPVPAIVLAGRLPLGSSLYAAFEATGLYASSAIINGANFEFEGSILDAAARVGTSVRSGTDLFFNLRFIGGSAKGTSQYPNLYWTQSIGKYTANYLATFSATFGATVQL